MAKRRATKAGKRPGTTAKNRARAASSKPSPQQQAARTRKRNAAKRARELAKTQAAEATAAATVHYAPPPFEATPDPSKAPGHQHLHPPMSLHGVKHSENYIAKARTPFNRRQNIGR
jgi:hypothetical protein